MRGHVLAAWGYLFVLAGWGAVVIGLFGPFEGDAAALAYVGGATFMAVGTLALGVGWLS